MPRGKQRSLRRSTRRRRDVALLLLVFMQGMTDGRTGLVKEWSVPVVSGHTEALFGIVVAPGGDVWFAASI